MGPELEALLGLQSVRMENCRVLCEEKEWRASPPRIFIFSPVNVTFIMSSLQSLLLKDVGSSLVVGAVAQPCPWAHRGRASEKATSWDDRCRMKIRRAGSCDARECLGIVQPVRTEIITLWNHLYTHFFSFLSETNMKHPSTFLLFHSESSSNIYRASLFKV